MANVKISELPLAQELWNLNELVAVVNSGNTTTSKRTYGSLFSNHSGGTYTITSNQQTYAVIACGSSSPQTHIRVGGIDNAAIIASRGGNITSGQMNTIIGCEQNSDSDQPTINGGQYNTLIASKGGVSTGGSYGAIIASQGSQIQGGEHGAIIASQGFQLSGYKSAGIAVESGGWGSTRFSFAGGGYQLNVTNGDSGNQKAALAYNGLTFDGDGSAKYYNAGMAVVNGTIKHDGTALIASSGRTTLYDYTLHTDNIHTYQGNSTEWRQGGNVSGAINVDLSTGNLFSFTITGNLTSVQLDNARMGGEYEFFVYNDGSYTITTMNLDGNVNTIYSAAGSLNPTNNGYSFYRLRIVDDGLGGKLGIMKEFLNYQTI